MIAFRRGVPVTQSEFLADVLASVASGTTQDEVCQQLRQRIDPAFVPRQIILVPELPRNATGKLPMDTLRAMAARAD